MIPPRLSLVRPKVRQMPNWVACTIATQNAKQWRERKEERRGGLAPGKRAVVGVTGEPLVLASERAHSRSNRAAISGKEPGGESGRRSSLRSLRGWLALVVLVCGAAACGMALSPYWQDAAKLLLINVAILLCIWALDGEPEQPGEVTNKGRARQ